MLLYIFWKCTAFTDSKTMFFDKNKFFPLFMFFITHTFINTLLGRCEENKWTSFLNWYILCLYIHKENILGVRKVLWKWSRMLAMPPVFNLEFRFFSVIIHNQIPVITDLCFALHRLCQSFWRHRSYVLARHGVRGDIWPLCFPLGGQYTNL